MSYSIRTTIDISCPPDQVYRHLTDIKEWTKWNPFIISSKIISNHSKLSVGCRLENILLPDSSKRQSTITFKPKVTKLIPNEEFEWLGSLGIPYIFDGKHNFKLIPTNDGAHTRLIHSEKFTGLLIILLYPFLNCLMMKQTKSNFIAFNNALKQLSEQ